MAIHKDLRIHQYLDDWLVRARSHQACLQHTQEVVNNVSATGLADELREIRAVSKMAAILDFQIFAQKLQNTKMLIS